jgi:hypothetical protein
VTPLQGECTLREAENEGRRKMLAFIFLMSSKAGYPRVYLWKCMFSKCTTLVKNILIL